MAFKVKCETCGKEFEGLSLAGAEWQLAQHARWKHAELVVGAAKT